MDLKNNFQNSNTEFKWAVAGSAVVSAVVLTFPEFFLLKPWEIGVLPLLQLAQSVSLFGWVALVVFPPIAMLLRRINFGVARILFWLGILGWPAGLILTRIVLQVMTGNPGITYLFEYPIFIITDIAIPLTYVKFKNYFMPR